MPMIRGLSSNRCLHPIPEFLNFSVYLLPVEDFFCEKVLGNGVQDIAVVTENAAGPVKAISHDPLQLRVYVLSGLIAEIPLALHLLAQEDKLLFFAIIQRSEFLAHTPLTDHFSGYFRGPLNVISSTRGLMVEHQLFGSPSTKKDRNVVHQIFPRIRVALIDRELLRDTKGSPPRYDGHLVYRIGAGDHPGNERMAGFVVRGITPLLVRDDHALALHPHQYLVLGFFKVGDLDLFFIFSRSQKRCLVDQVGKVSAGEAWCAPRYDRQVDNPGEDGLFRMHAENSLSALDIRNRDDNLPVESARPQKGWVKHVRPVGCGHNNDTLVRFEPVHFHEQLVKRLLSLVMSSTEARSSVPAHSIYLVYEYDAGCILLALVKQVSHARRTNAHEHFNEV